MNRRKFKGSWIEFLSGQEFTHAITLKPNDTRFAKTVVALQRLWVRVHMHVQRRLIGSRFHLSRNRLRQTPAIGIVEGSEMTGHIHGAFKVAPADWDRFEALFVEDDATGAKPNLWRRLVPSGTCVVERIHDPDGWHTYASKDVWRTNDMDRVVVLPLSE